MATDILVPPLSQTMDTLILVGWAKKVGDLVNKGETLYQVETDKATLEVESPATGILQEILAEAGAEVLVRSKIGVIAVPGERSQDKKAPAEMNSQSTGSLSNPTKSVETTPDGTPVPKVPYSGPGAELLPPERLNRIFSSPRARNLAREKEVPMEQVKGTGPQGMIVERDIQACLAAQIEKPSTKVTPLARRVAEGSGVDLDKLAQEHPGTRIHRADVEAVIQKSTEQPFIDQTPASHPLTAVAPHGLPGKGRPVVLTSLRKTIARRMQESHQTAVPVTLTREVDATALVCLRTDILKALTEKDPRPTYTDFLVAILTRMLRRHPNLNALFDGESLEEYDDVHIGIAVDTDRGLVVPVIHSTPQKGVLELAAERIHLAQRAQEGTLTLDEMSGGTFTITNLGTLGVDGFTPILNPPQVGILGVGRIRAVPAVFEGQISIRQLMMLSLTFDHRVVDGAPAARFLQDITLFVEKPQLLWL